MNPPLDSILYIETDIPSGMTAAEYRRRRRLRSAARPSRAARLMPSRRRAALMLK
jgi:hypothetical protein